MDDICDTIKENIQLLSVNGEEGDIVCDKGTSEAFDQKKNTQRREKDSVGESNAADALIAGIELKPILYGNDSEKMRTIYSIMRVLVKYADDWFYERHEHNLDARTQAVVQDAGERHSRIETDGEKHCRRENDDSSAI